MTIITDEREIIELIREADKTFEDTGGGTKHFVREALLPLMESKGWVFCKLDKPNTPES
jgi:hypothetical protein